MSFCFRIDATSAVGANEISTRMRPDAAGPRTSALIEALACVTSTPS
jgi:hypothetical protein